MTLILPQRCLLVTNARRCLMELRHLRYLVAVAEELSFRRAADRLHVSHPALSRQIRDLEDELGLKVFNRNARRVELTEAGRVFLVGARRTLASAREAIAQAREAVKGERGRLTIGCFALLTHAFLPEALARFGGRFPLVEVTVRHMDNRTQVEALLDGSLMLGLGRLDPTLEGSEALTATLLLRSPFCIACSERRWPAKRGSPKLSAFREDPFLALAPEVGSGEDYMRLVRGVCQRQGGFEPTFLPVGSTSEAVLSMVAAGRGVLVAPAIGFRDRTSGVNVYVLDRAKGEYELFLIRRSTSESTTTVDNFVKILAESVRRLQTPRQDAKASGRGAQKGRTQRGKEGME
jgi:DNA-binding transcriptional LysR family regulator